MKTMKEIITLYPVMAILRNVNDEDLLNYVTALYDGGIRSYEVSYTTPGAGQQINTLKGHFGDQMLVGAGTVLTVDAARDAIANGADFLLSPSTDTAILEYCRDHNLAFMPGVYSPSDVSAALSYGCHVLKLFPAADLPMDYIRNLKGPFPDTEYVAVGGVSPANASEFLKNGFAGVGIGGSLVNKEDFKNKNWEKITADISSFTNLIKKESLHENN